jgi:hypothetical protein
MGTVHFNELIEDIKSLTTEEKEEIKFLIEKYLIEERRAEIYHNYQESLNELKEGRLNFSNKTDDLKSIVE